MGGRITYVSFEWVNRKLRGLICMDEIMCDLEDSFHDDRGGWISS